MTEQNETKTVPVPPLAKMTDEQRDALLLKMASDVTNCLLAANEFKRVAPIVEELGRRVDEHDREIATLKTQVEAGVHTSDDSRPDLSMPVPSVSVLSVPPPMRPKFNTSESIHALALQSVETTKETSKQTPILEETKALVQQQLEQKKVEIQTKKEGNARIAGIAVGAFVVYLLQSQSCSVPHFSKGAPAPPPAPAMMAPAAPPPAK